MKASKDTQDHLQLAIDELVQQSGTKAFRDYRHQVTYSHDQYTAFIWGIYHALAQPDKDAIRHNQGNTLDDRHIETILKRALHDYNT